MKSADFIQWMCLLVSFKKTTPPQNRWLVVQYNWWKYWFDASVEELTFQNGLIKMLYPIRLRTRPWRDLQSRPTSWNWLIGETGILRSTKWDWHADFILCEDRRPGSYLTKCIHLLISKSQFPHKIVKLNILICNRKQQVDDFVGEVTF